MSLLHTVKFIATHPLNRGRKLRSILRFAKWQVGSRLVPGPIVYEWVNGSKFFVTTGETGLTGNVYTGLHEFQDMAFLLHFLRDEDLFVDIGANVGSYTILACSAIGVRGLAIEPIPITYKRLIENIHLNHLDQKVKCINKGLGARPGTMTFTCDSGAENHVVMSSEPRHQTVTVEVTSLDLALQTESPSLVKIDVEGYETPLLEVAQQSLKNPALHCLIMELNGSGSRYGFDESQILELMFDHGFETFSYNPFDRRLSNLKGKNPSSGNTLFVRDKGLVLERLARAPKVSIHGTHF